LHGYLLDFEAFSVAGIADQPIANQRDEGIATAQNSPASNRLARAGDLIASLSAAMRIGAFLAFHGAMLLSL
jgi:hypothetical protein